ncbi:MAG: LPS export ABC transporter periplasmic protein LptC [bacterium]
MVSRYFKKKIRTIFLLSFAFIGIYLIILLNNNSKDVRTQKNKFENINNADIHVEGVYIIEGNGDKTLWELQATEINIYEEKNEAILNDVKAILYAEDGSSLKIEGDNGRLDIEGKNIDILGNVIAQSSKEIFFHTQRLNWIASKKQIISETPVEIEHLAFEIKANKMITNVNLEKMVLTDEVKTVVNGKKVKG